jgi:hypothetical protein
MYQNIIKKVLTGEVRIARINMNGPVYSATFLISKTDANTYRDIAAAIMTAAIEGALDHDAAYPPIYDGDGPTVPLGEVARGCWVLYTSTKTKPQAVHQNDIKTELAPSDVYNGMYARASLTYYEYNAAGIRVTGCALDSIMKTRDGGRIYSPGQIARAGTDLLRNALNNEAGRLIERLNDLHVKFDVQTVRQLKPEQCGEFAAELHTLGAQI